LPRRLPPALLRKAALPLRPARAGGPADLPRAGLRRRRAGRGPRAALRRPGGSRRLALGVGDPPEALHAPGLELVVPGERRAVRPRTSQHLVRGGTGLEARVEVYERRDRGQGRHGTRGGGWNWAG